MSEMTDIECPFDPLAPEHYRDPRDRLADARGRCPVSEPRRNLYFVARDADVRSVLRAPETHSSIANFSLEDDGEGDFRLPDIDSLNPVEHDPFVTNCDPPQHTALRRMLLAWLNPPALEAREGAVRAAMDEILGGLPTDVPVDLMRAVASPVPARVVYSLLGIPDQDAPRVLECADVINQKIPHRVFDLPELGELIGFVGGFVAARRAAGAPDDTITDALLRLERDGQRLSDMDVSTHLMQLITAGTETTTSLIGNLLFELLVDRSRWERVLADRSLVPVAIDESLRHDTPLQMGLRVARHETTIANTTVSEGARVLVGLQSANLDEERWGPDAAEYSLDREAPHKHVSFGFGVHRCLGAPLARLEARVVLESLLDRFPGMALVPGFQRQPGVGVISRRPARLDVRLKP